MPLETMLPTGTQRIGINAHLLADEATYRRAGIHQYIAQVLCHLPWQAGVEYVVFARHGADLVNQPGFEFRRSRWPTESRLVRILWEQSVWAAAAARERLDLLHSTAFVLPWLSQRPSVVTIYDLSFVLFPERFPTLQRRYLTWQTRLSCRRARRIITISESGRRDVARLFDVPLERIDVVLPGVEDVYRPLPAAQVAAFRARMGLPEQFVLHVGTLQPRKNIPVLLEALARLERPLLPLVLVGGKGWLYDEIFAQVQRLGLTEQVRFAGYVPDEVLPLWYNSASLLVYPSIYEGFGMPVVEAMACGTPVVAANTSSLPEAGGEAAHYFAPDDAATLAERMAAVLDNVELATSMRKKGFAQAAQFSWARAGRETALVYQRALAQA